MKTAEQVKGLSLERESLEEIMLEDQRYADEQTEQEGQTCTDMASQMRERGLKQSDFI